MIDKRFTISSSGDKPLACKIADMAVKKIPAYRKFLEEHRFKQKISCANFEKLPITDKENYFFRMPYFSLLPSDHLDDMYFVFKSSGSSGKPFYWPQMKQQYRSFDMLFEKTLIDTFAIHRKRTLIIVGLALGSWIGGDVISWAAKNVALRSSYGLTVFSPGNQYEEIFDIIRGAHSKVDQILIFVCPSAIGHLFLLAKNKKVPLPYEKLRFAVIGEPFTENSREQIGKRCRVKFPEVVMTSTYGSADTGIIGIESKPLALFRGLVSRHNGLRKGFGFNDTLPNLFNISVKEIFIEAADKELIFTIWQGLPLIRYNLHDMGVLLDWQAVRKTLKDYRLDRELDALKQHILKNLPASDIIAIGGRSDGTIILCGTNISESMLNKAMNDRSIEKLVTGCYFVSVLDKDGRQRLRWNIELRPGIKITMKIEDFIYYRLVEMIGALQPEFLGDYKNVYCKWDKKRTERIFQINLFTWPDLSGREKKIKHRSIIKERELS
ncbi:MAG: hypothetical protein PHE80_00960 [Candidatus Omnitrophica bacterium]|nr:hypothetical protein [Candidatus Omnitrophota bacterium]MDD5737176.1 hypothetical protein [Candidatus Omnitrophota bacterium]